MNAASVLIFESRDERIRYWTRIPRMGPELELVQRFTEQMLEQPWLRGCHVAVLREPLTSTGYPDLLFVIYDPEAYAKTWNRSRCALTLSDLRFLTHLLFRCSTTVTEVCAHLAEDKAIIRRKISRLVIAGAIQQIDAETWHPVDALYILGVRRLIAFEAKMRANSQVVQQATRNVYCAAESAVLLPSGRVAPAFLAQFSQHHLGLWQSSQDGCQEIVPTSVHSLFRGFDTLRVNEWIGRRLVTEGMRLGADVHSLPFSKSRTIRDEQMQFVLPQTTE